MASESLTEKLSVVGEYLADELAPRLYNGTASFLSYASSYIWAPVFDSAKARELAQRAQVRAAHRKLNLQRTADQKTAQVATLLPQQPLIISDYVCS